MRGLSTLTGSGSLLCIAAALTACGGGSEPRSGGGGGGSPLAGGGTTNPRGGSNASGGSSGIQVPTGGGAGGREMGCNELVIVPEPVTPTVMVLVDNSSSMFEPRETLWDLLYTTLMDPSAGVLKPLESKIRFGFASYKGFDKGVMENDPACAEIREVPYSLDNFEAIDTLYRKLGTEWTPDARWETPTGHAINRIAAQLATYNPDPPGPKYILLVTDGNPNTCQVANPQCGQDLSIKAVQDAKAQGISTLVVGIGTIVANDPGCQPSWGRCGPDHLQDLANAGQGLGVTPPPEQFVWQNCADRYGRVLQGTYSATPGDAGYYTATSGEQLKTALSGLLNSVLSCTVDMNALVTGDESLGRVTVAGEQVPFNDPDGWRLEANEYQVTLQGAACERFKTMMPGQKLDIWFPCGVAVVR